MSNLTLCHQRGFLAASKAFLGVFQPQKYFQKLLAKQNRKFLKQVDNGPKDSSLLSGVNFSETFLITTMGTYRFIQSV